LEGAKVVVGARRTEELDQLVQEIAQFGGDAISLSGDVKEESYAKALVNLAVSHFGGLDISLNNAGTNSAFGIVSNDLSIEEWDNALMTNLTSVFLGVKYQLPQMLKRGKGSIIFTSSFVGYTIGFPQNSAYAASKSGLIGLTKSLAVEYGPCNIRIDALLPGGTDTPMGREFVNTPEALEFVKSIHAFGSQDCLAVNGSVLRLGFFGC
jgi:NAD(P)-dependent dehydrogenase (short-subunit alcohol dehydrogenase family)